MEKAIKKWWPLFVLPTMVAFAIGFMAPFIWGLYLSFCDFTTISDAVFNGFENYVLAFTDPSSVFPHALWYTALFSALSTVIINGVLANYGVTIVTNEWYGFWSMILVMTWQQLGYMMIIYISGLQSIPEELMEASAIDGANAWQTMRYVKLPMLMPSITICTFLTITNGFKLFDQNLALTNGTPPESRLMALDIYNTFYGRTGWAGPGQAKAVIFCLIVVAVALIQQKLTHSKEVQQ